MKCVRTKLFKGRLRRRISGPILIHIDLAENGRVTLNYDASRINNAILAVQGPIRDALGSDLDWFGVNGFGLERRMPSGVI